MIGVIIPDRNDRPKFLENCKRMIAAQSIKPDHVILMNDKPTSKKPDLTKRVREGFEKAKELGCEVVLIMENDDYYHPFYISSMFNQWLKHKKPAILGTSGTVYYHILRKQFKQLNHPTRASLMNTLIRCDVDIKWPADEEVFLDIHLWKQLKGVAFKPHYNLSLGIKHGQGLCGGRGHVDMNYQQEDPDLQYLKNNVDPESFDFYVSIAEELSQVNSKKTQRKEKRSAKRKRNIDL